MNGKEIIALMRKHKATIKALAERMGVTQKRIREVRKDGISDANIERDWVQGITGKDPMGKTEESPVVPETATPEPIKAHTPILLPQNLSAIAKLASKDRGRYGATLGVRLSVSGDGYMVEATNCSYLGRVTGPLDDATEYPNIPSIESAPNGKTESVIPAKEWVDVFRTVPKYSKPILRNVAAVIGENVTTLATTDLGSVKVAQPRNCDGRFPGSELILKDLEKTQPELTIKVNSKLLRELLEVAITYSEDGHNGVDLEFRGPKTIMVVRSKNSHGQKFTGLLVPLTK